MARQLAQILSLGRFDTRKMTRDNFIQTNQFHSRTRQNIYRLHAVLEAHREFFFQFLQCRAYFGVSFKVEM